MDNPVLTAQQAAFILKMKQENPPKEQQVIEQPKEEIMQQTTEQKAKYRDMFKYRGSAEKIRKFFAKNRQATPAEAVAVTGETLQAVYNIRSQLRKKNPKYFDHKKPGPKPMTPEQKAQRAQERAAAEEAQLRGPAVEVATKSNPYLTKVIGELELPVRPENVLKAENIYYIGDLVQRTKLDLMKMPNMGRKSIGDVEEALHRIGLTLGMKVPAWETLAVFTSDKPVAELIKDSATPDMVNSPPHYKSGGIETIDFIEAKKLNYNLGNVVKYITRADLKGNRKQDLAKALWYLQREISTME